AASIRSGRPIPGLHLDLTDAAGRVTRGVTDSSGVWRTRRDEVGKGREANLWLYGEHGGHPAFVIAGAPPPPQPFTVYIFSDRPIYRPGHTIQYRGSVRQRLETDAPGGFIYR